MAAGFSRVRIFSPSGIELAEMGVATQRSWSLTTVGRCDFTLPVYDARRGAGVNPQCSPALLNYGNLLLVEHTPSKNADGTFNGVLPPWVGIIMPTQEWSYGKVKLTAYAAEQVLKYRTTPMPFDATGTPGTIFKQIILWANDWNYNPSAYPIQIGQIDYGGSSTTRTMKVSAMEEIQALIKDSGGDWSITPFVTSNNQLQLVANYYLSMGVNVGRILSSVDVNNADPVYLEQGEFYNWVRGYSAAASTGNRNFATAINQASLAQHGLLGTNQIFSALGGEYSIAGEQAVLNATQTFLQKNATPTRTVAPNVLDVGNDFSFLRLGNTWGIALDTVGFTNGQLGLFGTVRITAMEYTELQNNCRIAGEMQ